MIIWEAPKSNDRCFCDRHPREEKAMVLWSVAECSGAAMSPGISGQPPEAGRSKERFSREIQFCGALTSAQWYSSQMSDLQKCERINSCYF